MLTNTIIPKEIKMAKAKKAVAAQAAQPVAPEAAAPTTTTVEPVQLTIADLQLLSRIVDLASRRGAFQASELSQVGAAVDKLSGFLAYVESVQKKEADEKAAAEATAPATPAA